MTLYARLREDEGTWADQELQNIEGNELGFIPKAEWVKVVCFDGEMTGLYVLTDDDDNYFTCHSIALEFAKQEEIAPQFWLNYSPNWEDTTYTITTPDGSTDFMSGESMWKVFEEAEREYGRGVTIRPSWYGEWDCGTEELARESENGCWYDKYGQHHLMRGGVLVNE